EADGAVRPRPLGYALLFLHRWLPVDARIVSISRDPDVLAVEVTAGPSTSVILSSFASKRLTFRLPVTGAGARLHGGTLTSKSALEAPTSTAVHRHAAVVRLAPNTIVALRLR